MNIFDKFFGEEWVEMNDRGIYEEPFKYKGEIEEVKEEESLERSEDKTNRVSNNTKSFVEEWKSEQNGSEN